MPLLIGHRQLAARPAGIPYEEPKQALLPASCRALVGLPEARLQLSHHLYLHHSYSPQTHVPAADMKTSHILGVMVTRTFGLETCLLDG